jgi:hypothetical protein
MKRLLIVVLAMVMAMSFAACGGGDKSGGGDAEGSGAADTGVVGEWKLVSAEVGGQEAGEDVLAGFDYKFTFADDDKASLSVMGQSYSDVKYTFDGSSVTFDDPALSVMTLKMDGSRLVYEDTTAGTKLFFEKQ